MLKLTKKQKEFVREAHHRYNIKYGATRSGKTYLDLLYIIPKRLRDRTGKDGLNVILGVSKATIQRNVIELLQELYGVNLVSEINSQNEAIIFGEKVYCLGAEKVNQVSKLRGASIKYCYCDELAEYNQEVFELLKSRLDKEYSCLDATLNPKGTNHWLKKDFLDIAEEKNVDIFIQHYSIFDNEFLPKIVKDSMCNEYAGTVYYNRYILGQWCNAEGVIFKQIAEHKDKYITKEVKSGIISIGIDWGGHKSKHTICATKISRNFDYIQVLASDKLEAEGTNTEDIFKWILKFIKNIMLKYGTIEAIFPDCAEQVLNNSLRKYLMDNSVYVRILDSVKIPIEERIRLLSILLNINTISFIQDETEATIEALQTAVFDEKAEKDRWIDDGETSDIDSLDAFCYSWTNWSEQLSRMIGG